MGSTPGNRSRGGSGRRGDRGRGYTLDAARHSTYGGKRGAYTLSIRSTVIVYFSPMRKVGAHASSIRLTAIPIL